MLHRIAAGEEDDRNLRCGGLRGQGRIDPADRGDDPNPVADQIGGKRREAVVVSLGPTVLGPDVLAIDIARLFQALLERGNERLPLRARVPTEHPDYRFRRLLRARTRMSGPTRSRPRNLARPTTFLCRMNFRIPALEETPP
jgi:hypothetical protein